MLSPLTPARDEGRAAGVTPRSLAHIAQRAVRNQPAHREPLGLHSRGLVGLLIDGKAGPAGRKRTLQIAGKGKQATSSDPCARVSEYGRRFSSIC